MYSVKIRKPGSIFSKTFDNVIGDGFVWFDDRNRNQHLVQMRYLILDDGTKIEIPFMVVIEFSKEREEEIREQIERESGQTINLVGRKKK